MTTAQYRQRQREINDFYDRAAGWFVGITCTLAMLVVGAYVVKVML
jgi:hypothetical protein